MPSSIIVAMDSLKGSLTTFEANAAVRKALTASGYAEGVIRCFPMSDGGEGFSSVVAEYMDGSFVGQAGKRYFLSKNGVAYIESAIGCGYDSSESRTPLTKSSHALGMMVADAASRAVSRIVIGLGGTSTCDAGVGALQALGVKFLLADGTTLPDAVPALIKPIVGMDASALADWSIPVELWVDTDAVFCGNNGAARVFGPQKGLTEAEVPAADDWMSRMSELLGVGEVPGAGAAGGLGGALHSLLGAVILSGAGQMIRLACLKEAISGSTLVITGEGRFDAQTATGKLPHAIAEIAAEASVPAICVCGSTESPTSPDFMKILPVSPNDMPLCEAMKKETAERNITKALYKELR